MQHVWHQQVCTRSHQPFMQPERQLPRAPQKLPSYTPGWTATQHTQRALSQPSNINEFSRRHQSSSSVMKKPSCIGKTILRCCCCCSLGLYTVCGCCCCCCPVGDSPLLSLLLLLLGLWDGLRGPQPLPAAVTAARSHTAAAAATELCGRCCC